MTLAELKALHEQATKGPWEADTPTTIMSPLGRVAGNYDHEEGGVWHEDDTRYIVALHNHFAALVERFEEMKRALREIAQVPSGPEGSILNSDSAPHVARLALANAEKPLREEDAS